MLDKFDLFIFDWDGTLMNTTQTIVAATRHACSRLNLDVVDEAAAKSIIGKSFTGVIEEIVPELTGNYALKQQFTAVYERYLNDHTLDNPLFDQVPELLELLKENGKFIAIATGRSRTMLNDILHGIGYEDYFIITRTACECLSKPHPQMLEEILDYTGVTGKRAVMVGDTIHDIEMAHSAGIVSVAVSHGAQDSATLLASNPTCLLENISQLYNLLVAANA